MTGKGRRRRGREEGRGGGEGKRRTATTEDQPLFDPDLQAQITCKLQVVSIWHHAQELLHKLLATHAANRHT